MTSKAKQYKAMTVLAGLLMTVSAGHCADVMGNERAGSSPFETGMNVKEMIRSMEITLPRPEPRKAEEGFIDAVTEAKAAIVKALETSGVDNSSKVTKLDVSPTPLGTVYTFQARLSVIGFAGPKFAQEYRVYGAYNTLTREVTVAGRELVESVKPAAPGTAAADLNAAREAIRNELESGSGVGYYSVLTGIQAEATGRPGVYEFKAHKRIVGHGWEERYSVTGTCDLNSGKVEHRSVKIWGNRPMWPML